MKLLNLCLFTCVLILFFDLGMTLKCRTGSQQSDEQFRKIMQTCRKRHLSNAKLRREFASSSEADNSEEDSGSDENIFDKKFMFARNGQNERNSSGTNDNTKDRNINDMKQNKQKWNSKTMNDNNTGNTGNNRMRNNSGNTNDRNSMNTRKMDNDEMHSYNNEKYDDRDDQACVVQCFFNQLNLVDQKGFPERMAVTNIMSQNIHNPELRDFIQESVKDCFRYLDMDMNKEKCQFSQNLLGCLADKGREKCEDWEDQ